MQPGNEEDKWLGMDVGKTAKLTDGWTDARTHARTTDRPTDSLTFFSVNPTNFRQTR